LLLAIINSLFSNGVVLGAGNHYSGYSAVDDHEIRYGGNSKYINSFNFAKDKWNQLGYVNIVKDTFWTYEDLTLSDYRDNNDNIDAYYQCLIGSDSLKYNIAYMDAPDMSSANRKEVSLHELGHALGLAHHSTGLMAKNLSIVELYGPVIDSHIINDYVEKWRN
jgi:hypothetical protein